MSLRLLTITYVTPLYCFHNKTDMLDLEPTAPSGPTPKPPQQVEVKRGSRGGLTDSTKESGTVSTEERGGVSTEEGGCISTEERGERSQPPQPLTTACCVLDVYYN